MTKPNYRTKWPVGDADQLAPTPGAAVEVDVDNDNTEINFGELSADMALTITPDSELRAGALLAIKAKSDGTARDITFAAGAEGPGIAGVISKTMSCLLRYDGTKFIQVSAAVQLD